MAVPHILAGTAGGTTAQFDANWAYFADVILVDGDDVLIGCASNPTSSRVNGVEIGVSGLDLRTAPNVNDLAIDAAIGSVLNFYSDNGTAIVFAGNISVNGATTSYNTSSDYRLKINPQPLTGSGAFIDALQPKTWEWVSSGVAGVGFIAHEVARISPSSVVGEKDAINAKGQPVYQALEYGSAEFIANIVAELQSLRARVAALEG